MPFDRQWTRFVKCQDDDKAREDSGILRALWTPLREGNGQTKQSLRNSEQVRNENGRLAMALPEEENVRQVTGLVIALAGLPELPQDS